MLIVFPVMGISNWCQKRCPEKSGRTAFLCVDVTKPRDLQSGDAPPTALLYPKHATAYHRTGRRQAGGNTTACTIIGNARFKEQIAAMLGRAVPTGKRGRPKKPAWYAAQTRDRCLWYVFNPFFAPPGYYPYSIVTPTPIIATVLLNRLNFELNSFRLLQIADDLHQVIGPRVPCRAEHAHDAFGRFVDVRGQALESDRSVDVIAQASTCRHPYRRPAAPEPPGRAAPCENRDRAQPEP